MPSKDLVVGDVVSLQTGVRVPADMRCITGKRCSTVERAEPERVAEPYNDLLSVLRVTPAATSLKVNKSMLTGEAEPCKMTSEPSQPSVSMLRVNTI